MAKKLRCTYEMEIDVEFENPEAAKAYFIDGEWKTVFYRLDDLQEVAEHLSLCFHNEHDRWDSEAKSFRRDIEGYGRYFKQADGTYKVDAASAAEIGTMITVAYESELDNAGTYEV
ncbi:MAG: hypothetical protein A2075_12090 [Geobacteraceae bacterium GWC2_58_44]|nr:MAG: hypothetical protein A2075_12090 [Geobacteraceae bacterium GWC2_58_44]HBG06302.1 hypothetical protein [Geobacter sp.]